jgi:hypothetical protein
MESRASPETARGYAGLERRTESRGQANAMSLAGRPQPCDRERPSERPPVPSRHISRGGVQPLPPGDARSQPTPSSEGCRREFPQACGGTNHDMGVGGATRG